MKLIMFKGLPASGKSTEAKRRVRESGGAVARVNKDDLRAMLFVDVWNPKIEKGILKIQNDIIRRLFKIYGVEIVIVDDTNLHPRHEQRLRQLAHELGVDFKIEFFDVPLEECIRRNSQRKNPVPEKVIRDMYEKYLKVNE